MSLGPLWSAAALLAAVLVGSPLFGFTAAVRGGEASAPLVLRVAPTGDRAPRRDNRFADLPRALAYVAALRRQGRGGRSSSSWNPERIGSRRPSGSAPTMPARKGRP